MAGSESELVCVGVITGPHGVSGRVRIKSFTEQPSDVAKYGPLQDQSGSRQLQLTVTGTAKGVVICSIDGIRRREQVEELKGLKLYLRREKLPATDEDEFYHADLIGLRVELKSGKVIGNVKALQDFGAGDLLEVEGPDGQSVSLPFTRTVVPVVDVAGGRVVVEPPAGLAEGDWLVDGPLPNDAAVEDEG